MRDLVRLIPKRIDPRTNKRPTTASSGNTTVSCPYKIRLELWGWARLPYVFCPDLHPFTYYPNYNGLTFFLFVYSFLSPVTPCPDSKGLIRSVCLPQYST